MIRLLEPLGFVSLAAGLHVLAFALPGIPGQPAELGHEGTASTTLQAASPTLAALAQSWDRPPDVIQAAPAAPPQQSRALPPEAPRGSQAPARSAMPGRLAALAPPDTAPGTPPVPVQAPPAPDRSTAPTLPAPAPEARTAPDMAPRGQARPAPRARLPERPPVSAPAPVMPQFDTASAPLRDMAPAKSERPRARPAPDTAAPAGDKPRKARKPATKTTRQNTSAARGQSAERKPQTKRGEAAKARNATDPAAERAALRQWGGRIRARIDARKRYPRASRASGTVSLTVTITRRGQLLGVALRRSSGHPELDRAAIRAVKSARFPAAPAELRKPQYSIGLTMPFSR